MKPNHQRYNYQKYIEFRNRRFGRGFVMYDGFVGLMLTILGEAPAWVGVIGLYVGIVSAALYFDYKREARYYWQQAHGENGSNSQS